MSHVVQFKKGKKLHLVEYLMRSDTTVCGKTIPPDTKIHHHMPEKTTFCKGCNEWVGARMMVDWLGTDFFTVVSKDSIDKQTKRMEP